MSLLFFKPIPKQAIWGKDHLNRYFGFHFEDHVGQVWILSPENECLVAPYQGKKLQELWTQTTLFQDKRPEFPFIISLVAPNDNLSIQVHPDDYHAQNYGYPYGKNECWYFIDANKDSHIVYNHHAKDKQEILNAIKNDALLSLVDYKKVSQDDFVYIPSGTLHALCSHTIVYEVQQATDVTYRLFDYHRLDKNGNERQLDIEKGLETLHCDKVKQEERKVDIYSTYTYTKFIENSSFIIEKYEIKKKTELFFKHFRLVTIIQGEGIINQIPVHFGDSFIIPSQTECVIEGILTFMTTH